MIQTEHPLLGPTELTAMGPVRFGRSNNLLSVLVCIKGGDLDWSPLPLSYTSEGGVYSDDNSLDATERQDNTQSHRSLESHYTTSTYTLIWQAPSLGIVSIIQSDG